MSELSAADLAFFEREGYLVVEQAAPPSLVDGVVDAIWDFLEMDRDDPADWYREPHRTNGMVELYHHPALWAVRQEPRLHRIFAELWGREDLWVSLDRANMKPPPHPHHPEYDHPGMVHWDMDVRERPLPFRLQGVLYLSDTPAGAGGFQCVPGFHRRAEAWAAARPEDESLRVQDVRELDGEAFGDVRPIAGAPGDLIVWHSALPHGNSANRTAQPRLAQYVTMFPAQPADAELRRQRVDSWRRRVHPAFQGRAFPGDPRGWEAAHYDAPPLTALGRRLLGLDPWPACPGAARVIRASHDLTIPRIAHPLRAGGRNTSPVRVVFGYAGRRPPLRSAFWEGFPAQAGATRATPWDRGANS